MKIAIKSNSCLKARYYLFYPNENCYDALRRSLMSEIASYAVVVDAIDAKASVFYQHHQFIPFPNQTQRLYLLMATISSMFEG
jgi:hypothetical protein